jgi:rusticyanin
MSSPKPSRDRRAIAVLVIVLIFVLIPLGYFLESQIMAANSDKGCQCFATNQSELAPRELGTYLMNGTLANETAAHGPVPSYAHVFASNRTIVFDSKNISLEVFSYPNYMAGVVLNTSIPSYDCTSPCPNPNDPAIDNSSLSNSFAIYGIIQPTLVIQKGSKINVTFVNMDPTDHHSFVLTSFGPPYPMYIMQNMISGNEMVQMTPLLPPVNNGSAAVYQYTINLNYAVTKLWYTCMFPMHASLGMWGNITIA